MKQDIRKGELTVFQVFNQLFNAGLRPRVRRSIDRTNAIHASKSAEAHRARRRLRHVDEHVSSGKILVAHVDNLVRPTTAFLPARLDERRELVVIDVAVLKHGWVETRLECGGKGGLESRMGRPRDEGEEDRPRDDGEEGQCGDYEVGRGEWGGYDVVRVAKLRRTSSAQRYGGSWELDVHISGERSSTVDARMGPQEV